MAAIQEDDSLSEALEYTGGGRQIRPDHAEFNTEAELGNREHAPVYPWERYTHHPSIVPSFKYAYIEFWYEVVTTRNSLRASKNC